MSKRTMLIMTVMVMIFIISIMGVARLSLKFTGKNTDQKAAAGVELIDQRGLNDEEKDVLKRLSVFMSISDGHSTRINTAELIYFAYLKDYYRKEEVNLSREAAGKIKELIHNGDELILLENESDIKKMSFDGREVAIYIMKQIYGLSGLRLMINTDGFIERIEELSGTVIYQSNETLQAGFQWESLIITLAVIIALLSIRIIIAKRKQVFEKGGEFGGFKEKGIA